MAENKKTLYVSVFGFMEDVVLHGTSAESRLGTVLFLFFRNERHETGHLVENQTSDERRACRILAKAESEGRVKWLDDALDEDYIAHASAFLKTHGIATEGLQAVPFQVLYREELLRQASERISTIHVIA